MRKNYAVIAAGGLGTRLKNFKDNHHTKVLIDIDGMSMISTQINQLKSWGFSDFVVITNPDFHDLIVDDIKQNHRNLNVSFVVQEQPKGIAHALSFAESKIDDDSLVTFGENPLGGINFENFKGSQIFAINVDNPDEFGVMELDSNNNLINIHEKPKEFISSLAVVGVYIYEKTCFEFINQLNPSARGELEITDLNKLYLSNNLLNYSIINSWWIDAGTEERIKKLKELI